MKTLIILAVMAILGIGLVLYACIVMSGRSDRWSEENLEDDIQRCKES